MISQEEIQRIARERLFARLNGNSHSEEPSEGNRRANKELITCAMCHEEIKTKTRVHFRITHQRKGRKWQQNGIETFYMCGECFISLKAFLEQGWL
jgi:hypothetical protein